MRNEKEAVHVAMILIALFCFLGGLAVGAIAVDRARNKIDRAIARDFVGANNHSPAGAMH